MMVFCLHLGLDFDWTIATLSSLILAFYRLVSVIFVLQSVKYLKVDSLLIQTFDSHFELKQCY